MCEESVQACKERVESVSGGDMTEMRERIIKSGWQDNIYKNGVLTLRLERVSATPAPPSL